MLYQIKNTGNQINVSRTLAFKRTRKLKAKAVAIFKIRKIIADFKCLLTYKTKEMLFREEYSKYKNVEIARASTEAYEKLKNSFYVNCWHMNDNESYLM